MARQVVVTGNAGMLGTHLVHRLVRDGHGVRGVDLRAPAEPQSGVDQITADICDTDRMTSAFVDADVVAHCAAALPSYPEKQIRRIIVDGTRSVFEAARRSDVRRVVHISSTAVYGLPTVVPTPEEYPRAPVDAYSRAKADAELVAEEFRDDGMCVATLRPKTFLGPGRMGLFAMLFEWAEEGRNFPVLGGGDVRIQMFAVEDLVDAVAGIMEAPAEIADDTYNLAAVEFGTLREEFQAVLDAAGHGGRVVSIPAGPALAVLRLLELTRLSPVYGRLTQKLLADSYVSTDKARRRFGFSPRHSNQEAILSTYRWWRAARRMQSATSSRGRTSRDAWRQGALSLAKVFF